MLPVAAHYLLLEGGGVADRGCAARLFVRHNGVRHGFHPDGDYHTAVQGV